MDYKVIVEQIEKWINDKVNETKTKGIVLGVSGGIDAAVCTGLAAQAIGADKVTGVLIITTGNEEEYKGGKSICDKFGIDPIVVDLQQVYLDIMEVLKYSDPMAEGNFRDRLRSAVLYYIANANNKLVASTVNKNEYLLGYFCKNGSGMADIMPIADVYKGDVWNIGKYIGVPKEIIEKVPTGDYWKGQTDEEIIGVPYSVQDSLLQMIMKNIEPTEYVDYSKHLKSMNERTVHKRSVIPRCILE